MSIGSLGNGLSIIAVSVAFFSTPSCSGGGGGGSSTPAAPTLTSAVFVGAGAGPQAGDTLQLRFSEDVALVTGATIDDSDVTLAPNGALATTGSPTLNSSRVVTITLAAGTTFTPGITTIDVATTDAVQDGDGNFAIASTPVTITRGDGNAPVISSITLSGVESALNGTGAAAGTLQVPQNGFSIDVAYSDASSAVSPNLTEVSASVSVLTPNGNVAPGNNLSSFLGIAGDGNGASLTVPSSVQFPQGLATISVMAQDASGMTSSAATFSFTVRPIADDLRPFETNANPSQLWFLDLSRDVESYTVNLGNASVPVQVTAGTNGTPDLLDILAVIGLQSGTPIAGVSGALNSNEVVLEQIKARLLVVLGRIYDGINVSFTFTSPGAFPSSQSSFPYANVTFSQICLAGAEDTAGNSGILGVAIFDPHNDNQNNNCLTDFQGTQRLGVFMHTAVNEGIKDGTTLFRQTYDPFTPARGGTPIGDNAQDGARLNNPAQDQRAIDMATAIQRFANMAAVILAHEAGHSVGLVVDSAMPAGLYGGLSAFFPGSSSGHIRNSNFPAGSTNVMSPSLSFTGTQSESTGFNTLNKAYLREQVIYDR